MGRRALSASEKAERQRQRQEALQAKQVLQHAQECATDPHLRLVDDRALPALSSLQTATDIITDRPVVNEDDTSLRRSVQESLETPEPAEPPNSPGRSITQQDEEYQRPPPVCEFSALDIGDGTTPPSAMIQTATNFNCSVEASFSSSPMRQDDDDDDYHQQHTLSAASSEPSCLTSRPATPAPPSPSLFCEDDHPISELESSLPPTPNIPSWFTSSASSSTSSSDPVLDSFLQTIHEQETAGGAEFLRAQGDVYNKVFRHTDIPPYPGPRSCEVAEPEHNHTLQEITKHLQRSLPSLQSVFAELGNQTHHHHDDPRVSFSRWDDFLSDRPPGRLSFRKTQASLSSKSVTITRQWDVDSVWFGAKDLSVIRPPNQFRLSFFPPHKSNISTNQVIQPHGLDLAHTRHTSIGSFSTGNVRFTVFMFFPGGSCSSAPASKNSLSLDRFRDLYDEIIIPAAYETLPDHAQQEIPNSYDLIYAKSRAYQERPGAGRWAADDGSRTFRLAYNVPAEFLSRFWASIVQKANQHRMRTRQGGTIAYFKNPRLLLQAHDLKNVFARPNLRESLFLFRDAILAGLDPHQLDLRSCWLDMGMRDHVDRQDHRLPSSSLPLPSPNHQHSRDESWTLLWKSACCRHLHRRLRDLAPDTPLEAKYYRSCLLRDAGTYYAKAKRTRLSNPGHPEARSLGIVRAKAYDCKKELFGVMFSDYKLFSSGFLPLLAFDEVMLKDLAGMNQNRQRAFAPKLGRSHIMRAWDANKRHLRAIASPRRHPNFGARKEATFRLDVILTMLADGAFNPDQSPHTGPMTQEIPLDPGPNQRHCPYWVVPTSVMNAFVSTQAARFVLPLDNIFRQVIKKRTECCSLPSFDPVRQILAFYTAQLFCRLLIYSLNEEDDEQHFDNWIWRSVWSVYPRGRRNCLNERRGLGLGPLIDSTGMLWIPQSHIDWQRGYLSLEVLVDLYIVRSPLQARLAHQPNVQALTATHVAVERLFQQWLRDAQTAYEQHSPDEADEYATKAIALAVEETARAYHQHLLAKLGSYWDRVRDKVGRQSLSALVRLQNAQDESAADAGRIPTAQMIHGIYNEAWAKYSEVEPLGSEHQEQGAECNMPSELPCWITTRQRLPPKDGWSDFVFDILFHHPSAPPRWSQLYFLQLYRTFRELWSSIGVWAGQFDRHFGARIGHYIRVMFNADSSKEVGTSHGEGTWYHGKPPFFQIQYWAPYFSPPRRQEGIPLSSVYRRRQYPEGLSPSSTSVIPTARDFHVMDESAWAHWVEIMKNTDSLRSSSEAHIRRHCRRALLYMACLSGPTWGRDGDVDFIQPWSLKRSSIREYGEEDVFRIPVMGKRIPEQLSESIVSQPTILLPTRDNVVGLLETIESLPGHSSAFAARLSWTRRKLDNDGGQYDVRDHLEVKQQAVGPSESSQTLLGQFLRQTEPPQREIATEDVSGVINIDDERAEEGAQSMMGGDEGLSEGGEDIIWDDVNDDDESVGDLW
ncbi:hypothetical protein FALBO_3059 [Fusarium albosuccineum]|uniref:Uncharacterized protein n=1 Tax=Fusarium albosuccineum TaxID=1237068 RepID=A0A8H4LKW6_9HYPO|nr:hypothetical protein FALBO_3059 [Fusarium albosuccineum]